MKLHVVAIAVLAGSCAAPPPTAHLEGPPAELAGRSAGPPQRCVMTDQTSSLRISDNDRHTLLYGAGKTIWANHLGQCGFGDNDLLVTEPLGSYNCRGDLVRSFDRSSHIPGPACVLGDFVPYSR
jgi:hypothetical protein